VNSAIAFVWTVVLAWSGPAPLWLLIILVLVVGVSTPASMIGFDIARTSNPDERLASATGIVDQADFIASLVLVVAIGIVLDWRTPGASNAYTTDAFGWAMSCQYLLWILGTVQIVRYRRLTRMSIIAEVSSDGPQRARLG